VPDVRLSDGQVYSHVAILHEPGHPEPWIIALSEKPSTPRALDYGMRCGIQAMFSDLKGREFALGDSQLRKADRMERLLLGLAIAIYRAISTGMWDRETNPLAAEAKAPDRRPARCLRSRLSFLTRGLRRLKTCIASALTPTLAVGRLKNGPVLSVVADGNNSGSLYARRPVCSASAISMKCQVPLASNRRSP
jgi:hypothetical protein